MDTLTKITRSNNAETRMRKLKKIHVYKDKELDYNNRDSNDSDAE